MSRGLVPVDWHQFNDLGGEANSHGFLKRGSMEFCALVEVLQMIDIGFYVAAIGPLPHLGSSLHIILSEVTLLTQLGFEETPTHILVESVHLAAIGLGPVLRLLAFQKPESSQYLGLFAWESVISKADVSLAAFEVRSNICPPPHIKLRRVGTWSFLHLHWRCTQGMLR